MATVEKSIEVNVPVRMAYDQWTQFEQFPLFMEGVEEVNQLSNERMHWRATIAGKTEEWNAVIVEQTPDRTIAWHSESGAENGGRVTFAPAGVDTTRITLQLGYTPEGIVESVGDKLGFVTRRVEGDLERFKQFIESRGAETGSWRGEIHGGEAEGSSEVNG